MQALSHVGCLRKKDTHTVFFFPHKILLIAIDEGTCVHLLAKEHIHGHSDLVKREIGTAALENRRDVWDVVIIGGGATGLGCAVEAATRGYRTLLLEQCDFAKGTSSRSTKLVHGGVRYLKQGNVSLVMEALRERGRLLRNAPHLVHNLRFVVPSFDWWEGPFYGIGMRLYDMLAGKLGLGPSRMLSFADTVERIPTIERHGLRGGVEYYDGQFDDARLAISLAQTACDHGAVLVNYIPVMGILKRSDLVCGVLCRDLETGREFQIRAKSVINAAGVFADAVSALDDPRTPPTMKPSQGIHIVLERRFLPGDAAIMVPQTDDGRVLFAIPWHNRVVVGTTDTPVSKLSLEPRPLPEELEFVLTHARRYLSEDPTDDDVLSTFAGLRPLIAGGNGNTAAASRDHNIFISSSGLITVVGGKWTTYRKMGEDAVEKAMMVGGLRESESKTAALPVHGAHTAAVPEPWCVYGSDARAVRKCVGHDPVILHPRLPYTDAHVHWAVTQEMARTVDDVLARRTRALLLDARAARDCANKVAKQMAPLLGRTDAWVQEQVTEFKALAEGYIV